MVVCEFGNHNNIFTCRCGLLKNLLVIILQMFYEKRFRSVTHFMTVKDVQLDASVIRRKCHSNNHHYRHYHNHHHNDFLLFCFQTVARRVICAYMGLLVNTKDDLSLAVVLNVPERGLDSQAFTTLKHAARNEDTSFFLAATSFVRRLELGGKIFAARETDPLRKHMHGLTDLVHFLDRLADILGEAPSPREATERLLLAIKSQLLKGWSMDSALSGAIEEVSALLQAQLFMLTSSEVAHNSTEGSPAQPKLHSINHGTAFAGRAARKLLLQLLDQEALFDSGHEGCGLSPLEEAIWPILPVLHQPQNPSPIHTQAIYKPCQYHSTAVSPMHLDNLSNSNLNLSSTSAVTTFLGRPLHALTFSL
uniref:PCNA-interacting partner n=1 Tax=Eptatretus burgeri TaxID=7764 RepID=A0A8C4R865_EPTBU